LQSSISKFEAERAELDAILASGMLGRTNNLVRLLTFVCEKHFEGATVEIKEYNLAVQVLGRPHDFDPQVDTIVRVTAYALRKRLDEYYRSDGANHAVRICLPPGGYVPKFTHRSAAELENDQTRVDERLVARVPHGGLYHEEDSQQAQRDRMAQHLQEMKGPGPMSAHDELAGQGLSLPSPSIYSERRSRTPTARLSKSRVRIWSLGVALAVLAGALLLYAPTWRSRISKDKESGAVQATAAAAIIPSGNILRAMAGNKPGPYIDRAGATWGSDRYCSGGENFSVPGHVIQGTEDPELFTSGRRGVFQCNYPVPPGIYEVHLLFAETSGFQENTRNAQFSFNGGPVISLDVVDDAAGDDIATTKVFTDISPAADGTIHIDFTTPESFLNAVEILPSAVHHMLPVRIVVGHSSYHDSKGNNWTRDRYFFGGRLSSFAGDLSNVPDGRLYEWHRFGHIHYIIPVAAGEKYTLRLYFLERWFGIRNGSSGGVGSRVFDVSCNGSMLLKDFDIFREAGNEPLVKTFAHIEPTAQGKVELYFTPSVNYPSISAIEIIPE
jgi:hypothetical protein